MSNDKKSWIASILKALLAGMVSSWIYSTIKKIRRYSISMAVIFASLIIVIYGIGSLLGSFFPNWRAGTSHILVGVILIIIAWVYLKYER
ncbi:Uncharacterised protein [uncultured archaeon]|nr:Uncharacterised protein [uncultured archaeon]